MAGTIIADRVQLDNLTDTFKIVSNTGVEIVTANSSGILTGVADGTVSESKIVDGAVTNAKLTLAANASAIKTALNASGDPGIYAARAWVNFNGTGTVAIRASGNVSSITDHGTGDYTINFTTVMPDINFVMNGTCSGTSGGGNCPIVFDNSPSRVRTTSTVSIRTMDIVNFGDVVWANISIHR